MRPIEITPMQVVLLGDFPVPARRPSGAKFSENPIRVNTKKIRILMIERGLRAVDLAERWGVTGAAVTQVIGGKRPTSLLLGKLAKALGVRLEEILLNGGNGGRDGRD